MLSWEARIGNPCGWVVDFLETKTPKSGDFGERGGRKKDRNCFWSFTGTSVSLVTVVIIGNEYEREARISGGRHLSNIASISS